MAPKYGFDEEQAPIELPKPKSQASETPTPSALLEAVRAGEKLGFVSREPEKHRRPGRRRAVEPQDKILVTGPQRVIDAFRDYCERENAPSYWVALEKLLRNG